MALAHDQPFWMDRHHSMNGLGITRSHCSLLFAALPPLTALRSKIRIARLLKGNVMRDGIESLAEVWTCHIYCFSFVGVSKKEEKPARPASSWRGVADHSVSHFVNLPTSGWFVSAPRAGASVPNTTL